ncbi:MAG: hypothetical protein HYV97_06875 [Bdellovibrio sp.]|nr:hypothetical protein [Bdellovibrio sp.]
MFSSPFFQIQNALVLAILLWGLKERYHRKRHVVIMTSALLWDLLLVIQIQFARHAIQKAMAAPTNPLVLNVHVTFALTTGLLYLPIFFMGTKLKKRPLTLTPATHARLRFWHKNIGITAFALRCLTFVSSFFINRPSSMP